MALNGRGRERFCRFFVLLLFVIYALPVSVAQAATGVDWLAAQSQPDGSFTSSADIAHPLQATADTLRTFSALKETSQPGVAAARQYLADNHLSLTEFLGRYLIDATESGGATGNLVAELLALQNADGGFGNHTGHSSTVLDTAFALEALALAGDGASGLASQAVSYLLGKQNGDGSWSDGSNTSSVYLTALAMRALWLERKHFQVAAALDQAQAFLLTKRQGAAWAEPHETALVLLALLPRQTQADQYANEVSALRGGQRDDGSWLGDVYVTALALRALSIEYGSTTNPNPNPDLGSIRGRVLDADTALPLANVAAELTGAQSSSVATASDGVFSFELLPAGDYQLRIEPEEYQTILASMTLTAGFEVDLGDILVIKNQGASTGTIRGVIADFETGQPLSGATITVGDYAAQAASDGTYQIANVPAGPVIVRVSHPDYIGVSGSGVLGAGSVMVFSPFLQLRTNPAIDGVRLD